jgi:hypothetical protein
MKALRDSSFPHMLSDVEGLPLKQGVGPDAGRHIGVSGQESRLNSTLIEEMIEKQYCPVKDANK